MVVWNNYLYPLSTAPGDGTDPPSTTPDAGGGPPPTTPGSSTDSPPTTSDAGGSPPPTTQGSGADPPPSAPGAGTDPPSYTTITSTRESIFLNTDDFIVMKASQECKFFLNYLMNLYTHFQLL